jgi:hypothetical protein
LLFPERCDPFEGELRIEYPISLSFIYFRITFFLTIYIGIYSEFSGIFLLPSPIRKISNFSVFQKEKPGIITLLSQKYYSIFLQGYLKKENTGTA